VPPKIVALFGPLLLVLDLCGTFVFALSGAMTGVRHRLDFFGVLVLSFAAATSGGIIRDVLLGATPPPAIRDWRYIGVSLLAGTFVFYWHANLDRWRGSVLVLDAAGLSLFAVSGAVKALAFQLNPLAAAMLGVLTGVGGGIVRDLLVAEVPTILRAELYAVAALAGASVVVIASLLNVSSTATALVAAGVCFTLRLVAIRRGWRLPAADEIRGWRSGTHAPASPRNEGTPGG
jgi:uncharacterized membrane protein YeiH